ncbi:MAG: hypothetical protein KJ556_03375 [Gammaproteobacteria bacterium]|nr:hypothetical protein [Gammaproteobacteria bacterium]MBU2059988.1 hypothetical protein [Gammaproteobacteria bacterium]MBU2174147.1 hypothetical protein [Gammaproteobacteria bacterium]MBU2248382.1 hypothetical protein [Gammaproteobacteria bacterium]MBU2343904.1 hypothetical protein [Gammaproteobacteria bacterium]
MNYKLLFLACLLSTNVLSGELTKNATVLEVANHATGNGKNFAIKIEGGTGPCSGWVYFMEDKAPSSATYNQAFSMALAALAGDKKVRIHNYTDDDCTGATFIAISR